MKHVLILGAAGFIGSHLAEHALAEGHHVTGVDNLLTGTLDNLDWCQPYLDAGRYAFTTQNVEDPWHTWSPYLLGVRPPVDLVLHLASPASPVWYARHPIETMRANAEGAYHALEFARRTGARFVLASTSEVYGDPAEHPQTEEYWGHVNPTGPRSMYDEAKRYAEALTTVYARSETSAGIVRLFNTYGPRMAGGDGRVIPAFLAAVREGRPFPIQGTGQQTRSLCYVSDTVAGIWAYALSDLTEPVNIGNPEETTILDLARAVAEAAGIEDPAATTYPAAPEDPQRRRPSIDRARDLLGWSPKITLAEGLTRTLAAAGLDRQAVSG